MNSDSFCRDVSASDTNWFVSVKTEKISYKIEKIDLVISPIECNRNCCIKNRGTGMLP